MDNRNWTIHRDRHGAPIWYQDLYEAWLVLTRRHSLERQWETITTHDHDTWRKVAKSVLDATRPAPLTFTYRNWRGEVRVRKVYPVSIRHGVSEWHKEPQWLMLAIDAETNEEREFAMQDMACWGTLGNGNFGVT